MYIAIILAVIALLFLSLYHFEQKQLNFIITGLDSGFSFSEIFLLRKVAKVTELEDPVSLFWSVPTLTKCISHILTQSQKDGTANTDSIQKFLSKLYAYKTKKEIESSKKKGIFSTHDLKVGQKLFIVLPKKGLFSTSIINNEREFTIRVPILKNGKLKNPDIKIWNNQKVSVYLWRKNDANYVFDTQVLGSGVFMGESVLYLHHTNNLLRVQKRKTVRTDCHIPATLSFILPSDSSIELSPAFEQTYRCVLEDISESGASIRIGGKGVSNIKIKLKFQLNADNIVMFGIVKSAEYNEKINQSRLHFECYKISPQMKNIVLSYVYKILPDEQKYVLEAIKQTENEESLTDKSKENPNKSINIPQPFSDLSDNITELDPVTENSADPISSDTQKEGVK